MIATDLDGTFFGADHRPEARSVAAMNAAQAAGIVCLAVTGRSHMGGKETKSTLGSHSARG